MALGGTRAEVQKDADQGESLYKGRIRYVGEGATYQKRVRHAPKKSVRIQTKTIEEIRQRKKYKVYCTYDELLWLRNLLAYRREKLGVEGGYTKPVVGTEESLQALIDMRILAGNKAARIEYNKNGNLQAKEVEDDWAPRD